MLRRNKEEATYKKAQKRLSRLETPMIYDWCDQAGTELARMLRQYQKGLVPVKEVVTAMACLAAAVDIIDARDPRSS